MPLALMRSCSDSSATVTPASSQRSAAPASASRAATIPIRALAVTATPGARHASIRFVAGELDLVRSRAELLALAENLADPILMIYGSETPPKSKAEMEALAALPNIRVAMLSAGKLSVHEEFPDAVANEIKSFLMEGRLQG